MAVMTERDALLRAVLDDPADDTVRLAFADWCDENGDPDRAEFVRVQVAAARADPADPATGRLLRRARELEMRARDAGGWRDDLVRLVPRGRSEFRRGFVEVLECRGEEWVAHARDVLAAHPVREVTLTTAPHLPHRVWPVLRDELRLYAFDVAGRTVLLSEDDVGEEGATLAILRRRWDGVVFRLGTKEAGGEAAPEEPLDDLDRERAERRAQMLADDEGG